MCWYARVHSWACPCRVSSDQSLYVWTGGPPAWRRTQHSQLLPHGVSMFSKFEMPGDESMSFSESHTQGSRCGSSGCKWNCCFDGATALLCSRTLRVMHMVAELIMVAVLANLIAKSTNIHLRSIVSLLEPSASWLCVPLFRWLKC